MSFTFPWRGSPHVKDRILAYLEQSDACLAHFATAFGKYLDDGPCAEVDQLRAASHRAESAADDLRREIEQTLYERELLPESRGDLLTLLESLDHIPGATQGVLNILFLERPELPSFLRPQLAQLVEINTEAYQWIHQAVVALMEDPSRTRELRNRIDELESRSDRLQQVAIRELFASELELARKLQIKDVIRTVGAISDRCEHTADLLNIIAIKRRI
jgi:predicted phosphate transport protein (TIGR00153 family)